MITYLTQQFKENNAVKVLVTAFTLMAIWWIAIYFRGLEESYENNLFTVIYPLFSLIGGTAGIYFSRHWGGFKSILGRSILMLSIGLLAQFIGQALYTYYIYVLGIELPYPSIGDIGYFGSILFYIYGVILLAKVSGLKLELKTTIGKIKVILIPLFLLFLMYTVSLNGYELDWSNKVVMFLDLGYPIGQSIYVSIAILAFLVSKNILGGIMRSPILLLIVALILQYIADFIFGVEVASETWYVAGYSDLLFATAYFLMAIALFSIGNMFYKVQES